MFTVLVFIIVLGILVFAHELGHFVVARRNGVEVEEFGFGFPPRIFGIYKNKKIIGFYSSVGYAMASRVVGSGIKFELYQELKNYRKTQYRNINI